MTGNVPPLSGIPSRPAAVGGQFGAAAAVGFACQLIEVGHQHGDGVLGRAAGLGPGWIGGGRLTAATTPTNTSRAGCPFPLLQGRSGRGSGRGLRGLMPTLDTQQLPAIRVKRGMSVADRNFLSSLARANPLVSRCYIKRLPATRLRTGHGLPSDSHLAASCPTAGSPNLDPAMNRLHDGD
jgi:hypothetical protein